MTAKLDDRVPQGESVVFRTSSRRVPVWVSFGFLALVVVWGLYFWASELLSDSVLWILMLLLIAALSSFLQVWFEAGAALVTEKRLLYDRGPAATIWGRERILDLPLSGIAEIRKKRSWLGKDYQLLLADGRPLAIGSMSKSRHLIDAVSEASGLPVSGDR